MCHVVLCNSVALRSESSQVIYHTQFQNPTLSVVSNSRISITVLLPGVMAGSGKHRGGVVSDSTI